MGDWISRDQLEKAFISPEEAETFKAGATLIERVSDGYKVPIYAKDGRFMIDAIVPLEDQCPDCRSTSIEKLRSRRGRPFNHCLGCGHWWPR